MNSRVPVAASRTKASMTIGPIAMGCRIKLATVAMKTASRCQAWISNPAGGGMNHKAAPIARVAVQRRALREASLTTFECSGGSAIGALDYSSPSGAVAIYPRVKPRCYLPTGKGLRHVSIFSAGPITLYFSGHRRRYVQWVAA